MIKQIQWSLHESNLCCMCIEIINLMYTNSHLPKVVRSHYRFPVLILKHCVPRQTTYLASKSFISSTCFWASSRDFPCHSSLSGPILNVCWSSYVWTDFECVLLAFDNWNRLYKLDITVAIELFFTRCMINIYIPTYALSISVGHNAN